MGISITGRAGAIGAATSWIAGLATFAITRGVDFQPSQTLEPTSDIQQLINNHADQLLAVMALDTLFVAGYLIVFAALFLLIPKEGRLIGAIGLAFGIFAGLGDLTENVIYVVEGLAAKHGTELSLALPFQYYVSSLKWMAAFTSVGITLTVFPLRNNLERITALVMSTLPLGGALSIAYPDLLPLRVIFFVFGMPLFVLLFLRTKIET